MPTLRRWDWVSAGKKGLEESEASAQAEVELSSRASLAEKKDVICLWEGSLADPAN
jgi:hypothetical protein